MHAHLATLRILNIGYHAALVSDVQYQKEKQYIERVGPHLSYTCPMPSTM